MNDHSRGPATVSPERQLSAAVYQWATGIASAQVGRVILCRTRDGFEAIARRGGACDRYLIPSAQSTEPNVSDGEHVLTFDGSFDQPGDVMHIGSGYEIELRDYSAIPFMPIIRPTVVSFPTSTAWLAFIEDADDARATGAFIPQLTSPSVVLSDRSIVEAAMDRTPVRINRLTVDAATDVRYLPRAAVAGSAATIDLGDQPVAALLPADGEEPSAGASVETALAVRPWMRRYLAALRIVGGEDGVSWSISGFGDHLAAYEAPADRRGSAHLITWRGDEYRLVAASGRRFAFARPTAIAVESLLVSSSLEEALTVARASGITHPHLEHDLLDLRRRLAAVGVTVEHEGEVA